MLVGVGHGSVVVVPNNLNVVQSIQFIPLVVCNPISKSTYVGVFKGPGGAGEGEWGGARVGRGGKYCVL